MLNLFFIYFFLRIKTKKIGIFWYYSLILQKILSPINISQILNYIGEIIQFVYKLDAIYCKNYIGK